MAQLRTRITALVTSAALIAVALTMLQAPAPAQATSGTGGVMTQYFTGGFRYQVHTFLADGTFTPPSPVVNVDYNVVSGGGGSNGGSFGAGNNYYGCGGGGSTATFASAVAITTPQTVTIGVGGTAGDTWGAASTAANYVQAGNGTASTFGAITATPGGGATQTTSGAISCVGGSSGSTIGFLSRAPGNTTSGGGGAGAGSAGVGDRQPFSTGTYNRTGAYGYGSLLRTGATSFYGAGGGTCDGNGSSGTTGGATNRNTPGAANSGSGAGAGGMPVGSNCNPPNLNGLPGKAGGSGIVVVRYKLFTVTYNGNTNTGGAAPAQVVNVADGETFTTGAPTAFTKTNAVFTGWNTAADGSGTAVAASAIFSPSGQPASAVTLFAQWRPIQYSVVFHPDAFSTGTMADQTISYSDGQTLTPFSYSSPGRTFVNWTANADGSGTTYANGAPASTLSSVDGATINLYAVTSEDPVPAMLLAPLGVPAVATAVGEVVNYSFEVTNSGNVALHTASVSVSTFTGSGATPVVTCPAGAASLAVGASVTCTASYTLTQADVDAGSVALTSAAQSLDPANAAVSASGATVTTTITSSPALTLVKSASPNTPASLTVGNTITYSFAITNTGNVTVNTLRVTENTFSGHGTISAATCPAGPLAPTATATCTATYSIQQADVDFGSIANTATARANTPSGGVVGSNPSTVTLMEVLNPGLTLVKSVDPVSVFTLGTLLTYSLVVTNSGNVTLQNVVVTDNGFTGSGGTSLAVTCPSMTTFIVGQQATCTATHTVTQADVDALTVSNTATVHATTGSAVAVDATSNTVSSPSAQDPQISLEKTRSNAGEITAVGQTVGYLFRITNIGNVSLNSVDVVDTQSAPGAVLATLPTCPATTIIPGAFLDCTGATYTVTQDDLDRGTIADSAVATAVTTSAGPVTATSNTATLSVPVTQSPSLSLVKSVTPNDAASFVAGAATVYSFVVTNTGNVSVAGVTVSDDTFTGNGVAPVIGSCTPAAPASLAPGSQMTCSANYTVVQDDIDQGSVTNTATAHGTAPNASAVDSAASSVSNPATQAPAVDIDDLSSRSGNQISYRFSVTNTGNMTLFGLTLNRLAFNGSGTPPALVCLPSPTDLAPGQVANCTALYNLTSSDLQLASLTLTVDPVSTLTGGVAFTGPSAAASFVIRLALASSGVDPYGASFAGAILLFAGFLVQVLAIRRRKNSHSSGGQSSTPRSL